MRTGFLILSLLALVAQPAAAQEGPGVLDAPEDVRETRHEVSVTFADGLANVTVDMSFVRSEAGSTQLVYRLPVPEGASLASFRVCGPGGCRRAHVDHDGGLAYDFLLHTPAGAGPSLPIGMVVEGWSAATLTVKIAPLTSAGAVRARVEYVVQTELVGGVEHLVLPARPHDVRLGPATVRLQTRTPAELRIDGETAPRTVALDNATLLSARWRAASGAGPTIARAVTTVRCGDRQCGRVRVAAAPRVHTTIAATLAVDVSPSMRGSAAARLVPALHALRAALPPGSTLRTVLFARHARPLMAEPAPATEAIDHLIEVLVANGPVTWLGPSTRLETVLSILPTVAGGTPLPVIVLGDGTLTADAGTRASIQAFRANGGQLSIVSLASEPVGDTLSRSARLSGGTVVELGHHAVDPQEAARRLSALVAPVVIPGVQVDLGDRHVVLGTLRAGEELVWEGLTGERGLVLVAGRRLSGRPARGALAHGLRMRMGSLRSMEGTTSLTAVHPRDLPLAHKWDSSGVVSGARSGAGVPRPRGRPPRITVCRVEIRNSLPKYVIRRSLQTMRPRVRACFSRARGGRPDYHARVAYHLTFDHQEVRHARVTGDLTPELEACLLSAIDHLQVPPTFGRVDIHYPFVVQPLPRPETVPLRQDVAAVVDALL